ncbi:hypothetical protein HanRHA438_Chr07g0309731 [Helianthus annuus]|nr:hypothetical protein HanRHA438_Chr07g0309731 [Helianthus annuus]
MSPSVLQFHPAQCPSSVSTRLVTYLRAYKNTIWLIKLLTSVTFESLKPIASYNTNHTWLTRSWAPLPKCLKFYKKNYMRVIWALGILATCFVYTHDIGILS